jgi:hypothetical protein
MRARSPTSTCNLFKYEVDDRPGICKLSVSRDACSNLFPRFVPEMLCSEWVGVQRRDSRSPNVMISLIARAYSNMRHVVTRERDPCGERWPMGSVHLLPTSVRLLRSAGGHGPPQSESHRYTQPRPPLVRLGGNCTENSQGFVESLSPSHGETALANATMLRSCPEKHP